MATKSKYILGINVLTNASCAIMCDGEIVYVGQEERFRRFKNITGFPHKALKYGFKKLNIDGSCIEKVGFSTTRCDPLPLKASLMQNLNIRDIHDYYGERYWYRVFAGKDCTDYYRWVRDAEQFNSHEVMFDYSFINDALLGDVHRRIELYPKYLKDHLKYHFNISEDKVEFLDHHTCHAYYGYFGSPFRKEPCVVVTLDGIGDERNQTVFSAKNDELISVASSSQNDIGRVYKLATLLIGMRPEEHEYKVMGMAPYAKDSYVNKAYDPIKDISKVEGMRILHNKRPKDLYGYLRKVWLDQRFDNICGAVQRFAEHNTVKLFESIYNMLGTRRFVISGGISMNIKMNKVLSELDFVDEFFVCGSGSDESLCMGACYFLNKDKKNNQPLPHLYLGYDVNDDLADKSWQKSCDGFTIRENVDEREIAQMLAKGEVIARIDGRAEFGARALGNRSILANPSQFDVIKHINEAIKKRDFWMPFALSVLEEDQDYCLVNPKKISSPFMSTGFDAKSKDYDKFRAGTHPYDRTVRPQVVSKKFCGSYHKLISAFKEITGVPAVLNTSFNLHGQPIVNDVKDAIATFCESGLKHLYLGKTLISKKNE